MNWGCCLVWTDARSKKMMRVWSWQNMCHKAGTMLKHCISLAVCSTTAGSHLGADESVVDLRKQSFWLSWETCDPVENIWMKRVSTVYLLQLRSSPMAILSVALLYHRSVCLGFSDRIEVAPWTLDMPAIRIATEGRDANAGARYPRPLLL